MIGRSDPLDADIICRQNHRLVYKYTYSAKMLRLDVFKLISCLAK